MNLYEFLEKPKIYNFLEKILSLGNKSCEKCLSELIKSNNSDLLLDVGCGTARYAELFSGKYHGLDINKDYIDFAKQNHKGTFLVMDAADIKFPDQTFDFVFNVGILHHIPDEKVKTIIDEMKRVCKNNGKVLIIEAVYPSKLNFIGYLLFKFDRGKHTRTIKHLEGLFQNKGFILLKKNIKGSFPYKLCVFIYQK
jgi:ubiquinone/menaquinone biosynthesis C-methylase UbiE